MQHKYLPCLCVALAATATATAALPRVIWQADRPWIQQSDGRSHAISKDGRRLRFEVRPGDRWPGDERRSTRHERAEVADSLRMKFGQQYVVEWTQKLSVSGPQDTYRCTFAQLHASEDRGDKVATAPVLDMRVDRGLFSVRISYSLTDPATKPISKLIYKDPNLYPVGVPVHFKVYVKTSSDAANGQVDIWRDGAKIVNYQGPMGYIDRRGPYWKMGLYRLGDPSTMISEVWDLYGPAPVNNNE